ncbi:MAG: NADPH:quinone oxidoreductase family protein [Armatimonadetes bacterium]|nr:NADPH:quinone oxidoreductase family protein [Armatimonadota bacterium]
MKAVRCEARGGPDTLRLRDVPDPEPGAGQALVRVQAAGVNYADIAMRLGLYPGSPEPPFVPGFEVCGTVESVGEGVEEFRPGDRVIGLLRSPQHGGYAEKAIVNAGTTFPLPDSLSFEEGAAFGIVFLTAYGCLKLQGHLQPGETVLIHAAGGGVGTAAVQLARAWGASVIATAGTDEKLERVRELGADVLINYRTNDFAERVTEATEGRGVDLVLESIGGEVFEKSYRLLAPLGRIITVGINSRTPNEVKTSSLLFNTRGALGFHMSALGSKPGLYQACFDELKELLEAGTIRPIIGHRFPLGEAGEAHRLMESRESFGKIVLLPEAEAQG